MYFQSVGCMNACIVILISDSVSMLCMCGMFALVYCVCNGRLVNCIDGAVSILLMCLVFESFVYVHLY